MQKQAPSVGRILVAVGFALSCFGLMLFLWLSFGGAIPLKPQSYRITAYFPEATQLSLESDVRIGGVSVGKVKSVALAPAEVRVNGKDTTEAVIEIEPEFAPISEDARAILRQKTLLGETYVELTPGSKPGASAAPLSLGPAAGITGADALDAKPIREGGTLPVAQVREATQFDEILNALDEETRASGQRALADLATALRGRGADLNAALGHLGPFLADAAEIVELVRRQRRPLRGLIRDTGRVFAALSVDDAELRGAIVGAKDTFGGLAEASEPLAESIEILPSFERELRATLARLDDFGDRARPLARKLLPVADDISPTLRSVRKLSPHLRDLLAGLDPLLDAAEAGFPALGDFLRELRPALDALDPFLANLNPVVRFLFAYRNVATAFLSSPGAALAGTLPEVPGQPAPRHFLRQIGYFSQESLSIYRTRLNTNRGNAYIQPDGYLASVPDAIFPNFDCKNTDYTEVSQDPHEKERRPFDGGFPDVNVDYAACVIQGGFPRGFGGARAPALPADP